MTNVVAALVVRQTRARGGVPEHADARADSERSRTVRSSQQDFGGNGQAEHGEGHQPRDKLDTYSLLLPR